MKISDSKELSLFCCEVAQDNYGNRLIGWYYRDNALNRILMFEWSIMFRAFVLHLLPTQNVLSKRILPTRMFSNTFWPLCAPLN